MQIINTNILGKPVGSIQSGHRVGSLSSMVIDPGNLKIVAFGVDHEGETRVLFGDDIRSFSPKGVIINDNDLLMEEEGLIRYAKIKDQHFILPKCTVVYEDGSKVGTVDSFSFDTKSFFIIKLNVEPSVTKLFSQSQSIIDRSQIINVEKGKITVKTPADKVAKRTGLRAFLGIESI